MEEGRPVRELIYVPSINPQGFVFFYWTGRGLSYSIRSFDDERQPDKALYGSELRRPAPELLAEATWRYPAAHRPVSDVAFWRAELSRLNQRHLTGETGRDRTEARRPQAQPAIESPQPASPGPRSRPPTGSASAYPILNLDQLVAHPSVIARPQKLDRILKSPISEDYCTWNVVQLMQRCGPGKWWSEVMRLARTENPNFGLKYDPRDLPTVEVWKSCRSSAEYEKRLRFLMRTSGDAALVERARKEAHPVEGDTEVDVTVAGRDYLVFVEAKLESDASTGTKWNPERDQIVRNIDVLLEERGRRVPAFLLLVKHTDPQRGYMRLIEQYRGNPRSLLEALPWRPIDVLQAMSRNLAVLRWADVLAALHLPPHPVVEELLRRV